MVRKMKKADKREERLSIGKGASTRFILSALFLAVSMWLTPTSYVKAQTQKRELARVGAFLIVEEVDGGNGARYRYAIQTTNALEDRYEKADLLLACIQMLPNLRIRFPLASQTREKILAIAQVDNQRPVAGDWLVFPDFESKSAIKIASPFDLEESFWDQLSRAHLFTLVVNREDLGGPPGQLTFVFTLDGYTSLASYLPCLFAEFR